MPCYDASRPATPHPIANASLPSPIVQGLAIEQTYSRSASPYQQMPYAQSSLPSSRAASPFYGGESPAHGSPRNRPVDLRRAIYAPSPRSPYDQLQAESLSRGGSPAPFNSSPLATVPPQTLHASPQTRLESFKFPSKHQVKRRPSALRLGTNNPTPPAPPPNPDFMILPSPPPRGGPFDHPWANPLPGFVPYPNQRAPVVQEDEDEDEDNGGVPPITPRTVEYINRAAASIGVKTSIYEDVIWTTQ